MNAHRIQIAVRAKNARKVHTFAGIDAAARSLNLVSGPSVLKRIRMAVQEAQTVLAEFDGVEYVFTQVVH